jgi:ABC-2 type transport system ATP-binding protein
LLQARGLGRRYGDYRAVQDVSFGIRRGEIVGLLGPNGAGKTTTMRMLTGFLPATHGQALIAGIDAHRKPREAHRRIGYMPENNPLYPEMRVREYLQFRAELKGIARRDRPGRIVECIEQCRIVEVREQVIGTLSKGYRQRVGLADAMLARPDVLILDEPTIGLDPNQMRETRALIRSLAREHTVLISSHILAEVEAVCRRVLIIVGGRLVADARPRELVENLLPRRIMVELRGEPGNVRATLRMVDGVRSVSGGAGYGWTTYEIDVHPGADPRAEIARTAAVHRWPLRELTMSRGSLEDAFARITEERRDER